MRNLRQALTGLTIGLSIVAFSAMGAWAENDDPVSYTLQIEQARIAVGQAPQIKIAVLNRTGQKLDFNPVIIMEADGPGGHNYIPIQWKGSLGQHVIVGPGRVTYIWGSLTAWYPWTVFSSPSPMPAGHYRVRYCDYWNEGEHREPVCSNRVELIVER